jgi:hypothetical protein
LFTNSSGAAQTTFRLQTIYKSTAATIDSHRLSNAVDPEEQAKAVKAVLIAQAAGSGDFVNVNSTAGGNLSISVEEFDAALTGAGAVDASTQRVTLGSDDPAVALLGTMDTDTSAMAVSLAVIDAVVFGAGTEAGALRVTLPTDGTGIVGLAATADVTLQVADADASVTNPVFVRLTDGTAAVDPAVDDTTVHATGTTTVNGIGGVATPTDGSVDANDLGMFAMSLDRRLHTDSDSTLVAGLLDANSPTTEVAVTILFDGSVETDISTTNWGASKAFAPSGTGRLEKICVVFTAGTLTAMTDGDFYFFDADPTLTIEDTDMTVAEAQTVVAVISLAAADYSTEFATASINCQNIDEPFHSITHAAFHNTSASQFTDEDIEIHVWYRRDS